MGQDAFGSGNGVPRLGLNVWRFSKDEIENQRVVL